MLALFRRGFLIGLLAAAALTDAACVIRIQTPPPPPPTAVAPIPVPTLAPVPTLVATPTPLPTLVATLVPTPVTPALPQCYVQVTRASTLEVCGYIGVASAVATTFTVNVQLESALATASTTPTTGPAGVASNVIGTPVPATLDATQLALPGIPAGSQRTAFRFDLTQAPFANNASLTEGQPIVVAIPPAVAGGADQARSRVVFLREGGHLRPHLFQATTAYLRGCVGVPQNVSVSSISLQLFAALEPSEVTTGSPLLPVGPTVAISATTSDAPPPWPMPAPGGDVGQASPVPLYGQGAPFPFPFPFRRFQHVYFQYNLMDPAFQLPQPYLVPGRRLIVMASATGFPRAFSNPTPIMIDPSVPPVLPPPISITPPPTTPPVAPGFDLPFQVLAAGLDCQAPAAGAQIVRSQAALAQLEAAIASPTIPAGLTADFTNQSVVGICMAPMDGAFSPTVLEVRTTADALEVHVLPRFVGTTPNAVPQVKPYFLIAVPVLSDGMPVRVVVDPPATQTTVTLTSR